MGKNNLFFDLLLLYMSSITKITETILRIKQKHDKYATV